MKGYVLLTRAGVEGSVAMKISGHKRRAVFDRYNITRMMILVRRSLKVTDYISILPTEGHLVNLTEV